MKTLASSSGQAPCHYLSSDSEGDGWSGEGGSPRTLDDKFLMWFPSHLPILDLK